MKFDRIKQRSNKYKGIIGIVLGILILIIFSICGPYIVNLIFGNRSNILGFDKQGILDYYGVNLSGILTLIVLVVTIFIGNKTQKEQFEFQMKERQKEFDFQIKQRQLEGFENDLKQSVVYFSDIDMKFFYAIRDNKFNNDSSNNVLNTDNYCISIICDYIEDISRFRFETIDKLSLIKLYQSFLKKNNYIINSYITTLMRICDKAIEISEELNEELKKLLLEYSEIKDKVDERNVFIDKLNKFRIKIFQNYFNELQEKTEEDIKFIVKNFYKFIIEINKNNIGEIIDGRMEKF